MKLNEIIKNLENPVVSGDAGVEVSFITADSREVEAGAVFVAISGGVDGHQYIDKAIELGAVAIVAESAPTVEQASKVAWVHTKKTKVVLAELSNTLNNYP